MQPESCTMLPRHETPGSRIINEYREVKMRSRQLHVESIPALTLT